MLNAHGRGTKNDSNLAKCRFRWFLKRSHEKVQRNCRFVKACNPLRFARTQTRARFSHVQPHPERPLKRFRKALVWDVVWHPICIGNSTVLECIETRVTKHIGNVTEMFPKGTTLSTGNRLTFSLWGHNSEIMHAASTLYALLPKRCPVGSKCT